MSGKGSEAAGSEEPVDVRLVTAADVGNGLLETLAGLAKVDLTPAAAVRLLESPLRAGVRTYVAVRGERVLATASLVVEQKFIHAGGIVGHIEDVAVHPDARGQGLGHLIVRKAVEEAKAIGCYKVILNCHEPLVGFYEAAGFVRYDHGMRLNVTPG